MLHRVYVGLIAAAVIAAGVAGCGLKTHTGLAHGAEVYQTCMPCHGDQGHGNLDLRAPAIAGLPAWYISGELGKFMHNIRGAHPDDEEGARMRPMARTLYHPGDVEAVAAYVASMPSTWMPPTFARGDTAAGHVTFAGICVTCHMSDGKGNQAVGAPPISQQADWYLVAQLKKFHSGMRGADTLDTFGAQMRAMSLTLPDTTAMHDVIAYVKSLPH